MEYDVERVRALSKIARVALSEEEVVRLSREMGAMREMADALRMLPEGAVDADLLANAVPLSELREDVVCECADVSVEGGFFTVPRTVEE